jgi:hypothetical protein
MATYNGHKNWNFWNVSLWVNNDEGLYSMVKDAIASTNNREEAARVLMNTLRTEQGTVMPETPDGAPYTRAALKAAMVGFPKAGQ